jgi:hypothetical protein
MNIVTSQDYWFEQSLPLWAHAEQNRVDHKEHVYSVFKEGVAYCSSCGIALTYDEDKESYE